MNGVAVPALSVEAVRKSYGGPNILEDVSLEVFAGEILGIVGPNGSGKTTLFGVISGAHAPSAGRVLLKGRDVTGLGAAERAKSGIGRTFQVPQTFSQMTVYENLLVAAKFGAGLPDAAAEAHIHQTLELCAFSHRINAVAGELSLLDRKRLELARALALKPEVLLLDEIAGGLTDHEAEGLVETITLLARQGIAVIWIEHLVHVLTHAAHRLAVLGEGRIIAAGNPHDTMQLPRVRQIYFGMEPVQHDLDQ
jgi:branched-chain amino acid transport system ATP-binding protein